MHQRGTGHRGWTPDGALPNRHQLAIEQAALVKRLRVRSESPEWRALTDALDLMWHWGWATPCAGRDEWTSDDPEDREYAAHGCARCPIQAECRAAGQKYDEFGVWGGECRRIRRTKEEMREVAA